HGFHFHSRRRLSANVPFALAERVAGRWTDYLVVINDEDATAARRLGLVPPGRLVQMPGIGIGTSRFRAAGGAAEDNAPVPAALGLGAHGKLVLCIAEFTHNKRHADVARAFARVGDAGAQLALAGREGPALAETHRLVAELGLEARVHFLGFRDDIAA